MGSPRCLVCGMATLDDGAVTHLSEQECRVALGARIAALEQERDRPAKELEEAKDFFAGQSREWLRQVESARAERDQAVQLRLDTADVLRLANEELGQAEAEVERLKKVAEQFHKKNVDERTKGLVREALQKQRVAEARAKDAERLLAEAIERIPSGKWYPELLRKVRAFLKRGDGK